MNSVEAKQFTWDMMILCKRMDRVEKSTFADAHGEALRRYGHGW